MNCSYDFIIGGFLLIIFYCSFYDFHNFKTNNVIIVYTITSFIKIYKLKADKQYTNVANFLIATLKQISFGKTDSKLNTISTHNNSTSIKLNTNAILITLTVVFVNKTLNYSNFFISEPNKRHQHLNSAIIENS